MLSCYRPWESGRFRMEPGLGPLSQDLGQGRADSLVFQLEEDESACFRNRWQAFCEDPDKYSTCRLDNREAFAVIELICRQLELEYPNRFRIQFEENALHGMDTESQISFSCDASRAVWDSIELPNPMWMASFLISEDFAVMDLNDSGAVARAGVITAPNHWAPSEKFNQNFFAIHQPVPHMQKINQAHLKLLKAAFKGGAKVRFAWGVATDDRLNHHPIAPLQSDPTLWQGRVFNPKDPRLYVRVERQVLFPVFAPSRLLFTIRTRFEDVRELPTDSLARLHAALSDMDTEVRAYKGLDSDMPAITAWLENQIQR